MRYYRIEITDKNGEPILDDAGNEIGPFDSSDSPGYGLHVSFDIQTLGLDMNIGGAPIAIYGLPISVLRQAVNLTGAKVIMYAGMLGGLPLSQEQPTPNLILDGYISYAFGNWEGINQSLNLVVWPINWTDDQGNQIKITLNGKRGDRLSSCIMNALVDAYPDVETIVDIRDSLVLTEDWVSPCYSIFQLADMLKRNTPALAGDNKYKGVTVVIQSGAIYVRDDSYSDELIELEAHDFIGQPTWIAYNVLSLKTPLRGDLQVFDKVRLPEGLSDSPLSVGSQRGRIEEKNRANFTGDFEILSIRHIGEYSNPSGEAWVTVFNVTEIIKEKKDGE